MAGPKVAQEFEINERHLLWLQDMAASHSLPGIDKALRIVLDFAAESDGEAVFTQVRCQGCG